MEGLAMEEENNRAWIKYPQQKAVLGESSLEEEKWYSPLKKVISELAIKVREDGEDAKWGDSVELIKGVIHQMPGSGILKIWLGSLVEEFHSPVQSNEYFGILCFLLMDFFSVGLPRQLIQEELVALAEAVKSAPKLKPKPGHHFFGGGSMEVPLEVKIDALMFELGIPIGIACSPLGDPHEKVVGVMNDGAEHLNANPPGRQGLRPQILPDVASSSSWLEDAVNNDDNPNVSQQYSGGGNMTGSVVDINDLASKFGIPANDRYSQMLAAHGNFGVGGLVNDGAQHINVNGPERQSAGGLGQGIAPTDPVSGRGDPPPPTAQDVAALSRIVDLAKINLSLAAAPPLAVVHSCTTESGSASGVHSVKMLTLCACLLSAICSYSCVRLAHKNHNAARWLGDVGSALLFVAIFLMVGMYITANLF